MACTTGCKTKDHESYSACLQDKGVRVAYANSVNGSDMSRQKKWDAALDAYSAARAEGLQPEGTSMKQVDKAKKLADTLGVTG